MDADDFCFMPATALLAGYRSGAFSPVEVTEAVIGRIERLNPILNAYVTPTPERALEDARRAERAYTRGTAGPLAGVPLSIKDLTPTKGIRTARGSLLYEDWVPDYDAPVVERLMAAGGVLLGKTNTPELGWKGDSGNRVFGPTHNPWCHGLTAGGSSGGAAAAVAAGLGPLAQGSDGAGSVRIPAAFCGIYGYKPSWGAVPQYPASAVELFSHLGPLTRTVEDAALMLGAMAGEDARDPLTFGQSRDYRPLLQGDVSGLRVAWSPDLGYGAVESQVKATAEAAARVFEALGCRVEAAHPDLDDPWEDIVDVIWSTAFAGLYLDRLSEVGPRMDPGLVAVVERGAGYSAAQLAAAVKRRQDYYHGWRRFMDDYDLMLTPTLPVTAFTAGDDHPGRIDGRPTSYLGWTAFTYPFNVTGQPAATLPCGRVDDLPVGLQVIGRWRDDATVLRASAAFEAVAPWAGQRPGL